MDGEIATQMHKKPDPVLFLDFDGVLHPVGVEALDENFELIANPLLFCWHSILENLLAPYPQMRIIVSSDWRRLFDDTALTHLLGPQLGLRFDGVVECYKDSRVEEILAEANRRDLPRWLALDDHPSVLKAYQAGDSRFLACPPDTGISDPQVQRELGRRMANLV